MGWIISPTEPPALRALGKVSMVGENFGSDILIPELSCGIQRKDTNDLISSANTDRLAVQIQKMRPLKHRFLIIEGRFRWTADGSYIGHYKQRFNRRMLDGLLFSIQEANVKVVWSDDIAGTIEALKSIERWVSKPVHTFLTTRSKAEVPVSEWGEQGNREYMMFVLSSWPGINRVIAGRIIDKFGEAIVQWQVTPEELMTVEGISKGRMMKVLPWLKQPNGSEPISPPTTRSVKREARPRAAIAVGKSKSGKPSHSSKKTK